MATDRQTILIHPAARPKPPEGAPCNGCGVCCLAEPCPIGALLSGRRQGACTALRWAEAEQCYRCGLLTDTRAVLPTPVAWVHPWVAALGKRWISAGSGCDCSYEA
jgi:hypothetical protein